MLTDTMRPLALGASLAFLLSGCGDLTAGGLGEGQATVVGDDPSSASLQAESQAPSLASAPSDDPEDTPLQTNGNGLIQGDILVTLTILLIHQDGTTTDLSGGPTEMILQANGSNSIAVDPVGIPTGPYGGVRVVFHSVAADVRSGLPFSGSVTVDFGGANTLVVERALPFLVDEDTRVNVLVNLKSSAWLVAATQALPVVAGAQFRNRVEIQITQD